MSSSAKTTRKTSLVEAVSLRFANRPHRSKDTYKPPYTTPPPTSTVTIRYSFSRDELRAALQAISSFRITLPISTPFPSDLIRVLPSENILLCQDRRKLSQKSWTRYNSVFARLEHVQLPTPSGPLQVHIVRWENDTLLKASADNPIEYGVALARFARDATYAFKAERYNLGTSAAGSNRILASDATNLPEVLAQIQPHPAKWRQFNDYVKLVFPRLPAISVVPVDQSQVQIQIWNEDPTNLPQELAVSLAESGTGVGQVLSILAVVLTADDPRTIIIDEPQSFLHPGALRTLVRILADHSHHQFVIATHSTTVITASRPAQVLRVIKPKAATVIQILNSNDTDDLRMFLRDVGARLSDVFGAEQVPSGRWSDRRSLFSRNHPQLRAPPLLWN